MALFTAAFMFAAVFMSSMTCVNRKQLPWGNFFLVHFLANIITIVEISSQSYYNFLSNPSQLF